MIIVGTAGDPRVEGFQAALRRAGKPKAGFVDYDGLMGTAFADAAFVRVESPGRAPDRLAAILALGGLAAEKAARLVHDEGRLLPSRIFYRGLTALMDRLAAVLPLRTIAAPHPDDVAILFDKSATHARFAAAGLSVPRALGAVAGFDDLMERMRTHRTPRVFVKARYGSAASGVIAFEASSMGIQGRSTVELVSQNGRARLYNSRVVRRLVGSDLKVVIDTLACQDLHIEAWVPKAGADGRTGDLRVLVIAGRVSHIALRLSRGPITNLHLGNERAPPDALRVQMRPSAWEAMLETCRRAAALFPRSLFTALDVAVTADLRSHAILEANAFGDFLKGVLLDGLDPYDVQVRALPAWLAERRG